MSKSFSLLAVLILIFSHFSRAQDEFDCPWIREVEDDLFLKEFREVVHDLDSSWMVWKELSENKSYSYLAVGSSSMDYGLSYTGIEVDNGKVTGRKHFSFGKKALSHRMICQPSFQECGYTKKAAELRKAGDKNGFYQVINEHSQLHKKRSYKTLLYNCWEEYDEFVGMNDRFGFPPKTIDELYEDCRSYIKEAKEDSYLSITMKINTEGILCQCTLHNPLVMDADYMKGFKIKRLQWEVE